MIYTKKCNIGFMTTAGERIKKRRKELRMSLAELGKQCGVSRVAVGYWEDGQNRIGGENLVKVASALGVTPEWIINGDNKKTQKAEDLKFVEMVMQNIDHLNESERKDIELLIGLAKERKKIIDKYK